ncbi:MAG: hypothetical protein LBP95_00305 [Deltaproteobacteria bacterium]|jgi:hypothetical protein|nr:hypothetical protein [Deltaproteobacteria bacterium]
MLKKFSVAIAAIFVLAMVSSAVFAQIPNVALDQETVDTFLTVYSNPDPTAIGQASATVGDPMKFAAASAKIQLIYQLKKAGTANDAIKTTAQASGLAIDDADLAIYDANADKITEALDKVMAAAMSAVQ